MMISQKNLVIKEMANMYSSLNELLKFSWKIAGFRKATPIKVSLVSISVVKFAEGIRVCYLHYQTNTAWTQVIWLQ